MIELQLAKTFNGNPGFDINVSMNIQKGSFTALYGNSGSGKTSILRMIAGLLKPDNGSIIVNGQFWYTSEKHKHILPSQRKTGYLLQEGILFPNMDVKGNLVYALGKKGSTDYFNEIVQLMDLTPLLHKPINELSGGQQQRAALARTLLTKPDILLLDEPFTALDSTSKAMLLNSLKQIHKRYGLTTIMVSHSIAEIALLADKVYIITNGEITGEGTPLKVFADKQQSNTIVIPAEVISINPIEQSYTLTVLIQESIITLPVVQSNIPVPAIGSTIWLEAGTFKLLGQ